MGEHVETSAWSKNFDERPQQGGFYGGKFNPFNPGLYAGPGPPAASIRGPASVRSFTVAGNPGRE